MVVAQSHMSPWHDLATRLEPARKAIDRATQGFADALIDALQDERYRRLRDRRVGLVSVLRGQTPAAEEARPVEPAAPSRQSADRRPSLLSGVPPEIRLAIYAELSAADCAGLARSGRAVVDALWVQERRFGPAIEAHAEYRTRLRDADDHADAVLMPVARRLRQGADRHARQRREWRSGLLGLACGPGARAEAVIAESLRRAFDLPDGSDCASACAGIAGEASALSRSLGREMKRAATLLDAADEARSRRDELRRML